MLEPIAEPPSLAELAGILGGIIGIAAPAPDDNLFEVGGDSLHVLRLSAILAERYGVELGVATIANSEDVAEIHAHLMAAARPPGFASVMVADLRLADGRRRQWVVTAEPGQPEDSDVPPSYNQENHMRARLAQQAEGVWYPRWQAVSVEIPGILDDAALNEALTGFVRRHETLRSCFRHESGRFRRTVRRPEAVLVRAEAPDTGDDDVKAWFQRVFDAGADPFVWPSYAFVTVEHEQHTTTLLLGFDATNVDQYSLVLAANDIYELYAAALARQPASLPPVGSFVDYCAIERRDDDPAALERAAEHWRPFTDAQPRFPMDLGVTPASSVPLVQREVPLVGEPEMKRFEQWCTERDGDMFSGLLAVMAVGLFQLTGEKTYRTVVPLQTRSRVDWSAAMGWFVNGAPIEVTVGAGDDFTEILHATYEAFLQAVTHCAVPLVRVLEHLAVARPVARRDLYSWFSYADVRRLPGGGAPGGWRVTWVTKALSYGNEVDFWVNRTPTGTNLFIRFPSTEPAGEQLALLTRRVRALISELPRHDGRIPATGQGRPDA
jgi:hypothetical protein